MKTLCDKSGRCTAFLAKDQTKCEYYKWCGNIAYPFCQSGQPGGMCHQYEAREKGKK